MKIAIRVDASVQIGTGHFIRCLTLGDALKQRGAQIRFVSRNLPEHLKHMLALKGHQFMPLDGKSIETISGDLFHSHWLATGQHTDAQESIQALSDHAWDWLVVDHYALDARWESALRQAAKSILAIDDIADRAHDCDMLLDQNYYADMHSRYTGKVPGHCQLLLGPHYALLRDEFRQLHKQVKPRTGAVQQIFVFFGGIDVDNYTGLALKALAEISVKELHVDVVIGAQHSHRAEIETTCAEQGFVCHVQTSRMAELMAAADLAIGAGGSAAWERCCLGLPALSICIARNQRKQIADAAEAGLLYAPTSDDELVGLLKNHMKALLENASLLRLISNTAMKAVDGRGVMRAVNALGVSSIEIRLADQNDSSKLFEWRNHPTIRLVSNNPEPIEWENHQSWFAAVLANKDRVLLIGHIGDEQVGVVRFEMEGDVAEISIYLVPEGGFKGQGCSLLLGAEQWLKINRADIKRIRASVLSENESSKRLFLSAIYRPESTYYVKEL